VHSSDEFAFEDIESTGLLRRKLVLAGCDPLLRVLCGNVRYRYRGKPVQQNVVKIGLIGQWEIIDHRE
jgi:hypothetical protein